MLHKSETGTAATRRWRADRSPRCPDVASSRADAFAEDLALFERQVRQEARAAAKRRGEPACKERV